MIDIKEIEKVCSKFQNLYHEHLFIKGEINVCAVYDGKRLIHYPDEQNKEKYKDTFVEDVYEIKISLSDRKVYEIGNKLEKIPENHFNSDNSCCLGLFTKSSNDLLEYVQNRVLPFFIWQAYKRKYKKIPPWGEWPHGKEGEEEFKKAQKSRKRNDSCGCGSGKKYKYCCL